MSSQQQEKTRVILWEVSRKGFPFLKNLKNYRSNFFSIEVRKGFAPPDQADYGWRYTPIAIINNLTDSNVQNGSILSDTSVLNFIIVDVELDDRYYARLISNNIVIISYYHARHILNFNKIPLKNLLFKTIYECYLLKIKYGNDLNHDKAEKYTIHEDIGCIFDMNGQYDSLPISTRRLQLSDYSQQKLQSLSRNDIYLIRKELKRFKPNSFHQLTSFVEKNFIVSIIIFILINLFLNISSSFIYSFFK